MDEIMFTPKIQFSEADLKKLELLMKSFGMKFGSLKKSHLLRRVRVRMMRTNFTKFDQYYRYAKNNEDERRELRMAFSINVTRFFRNPDTFQVIKQQVLPTIRKKVEKDKSLKIWSAGCADGAEAYTLAILCEQLNLRPLRVRIVATDFNQQLLIKARQGIYPQEYLEETPPEVQRKYFTPKTSEHVQVSPHLLDYIEFRFHNMTIERARPPGTGYDLIVCRNVMIYFSKDQQYQIFQMFDKALKNQSFLVLGRTEVVHPMCRNQFKAFDSRHRIYIKAQRNCT